MALACYTTTVVCYRVTVTLPFEHVKHSVKISDKAYPIDFLGSLLSIENSGSSSTCEQNARFQLALVSDETIRQYRRRLVESDSLAELNTDSQ